MARDMIGPQWFLCSLLFVNSVFGQTYSYIDKRAKPFGDVTEEEVAIDDLEDYLRGQSNSHTFGSNHSPQSYDYQAPDFHSIFKLDEKIDFAVTPRDPRYFIPSSVLRSGELVPLNIVGNGFPPIGRTHIEGIPPLIHATREILPMNNAPAEDMSRKSQEFGVEPTIPHQSPLLRELYSRFSPEVYGGSYGEEEGAEGSNEFYKGHKFGPKAVENEDSKPNSDSVNFLQESRHQAQVPEFFVQQPEDSGAISDFYFVAVVSGCTAAAVCAVVGAGICYLKLHKSKRDAADTEYPAYGVTGPCKDFSPAAADRKLAQSAHMFHYQHQKQQMIALEKSSGDERHCSTSDVDSEEGEEGDYTVYECPGLAPTDEMEVKNPLFSDDPTPATPGRQQKDQEKKEGQEDEEEEEELENH